MVVREAHNFRVVGSIPTGSIRGKLKLLNPAVFDKIKLENENVQGNRSNEEGKGRS